MTLDETMTRAAELMDAEIEVIKADEISALRPHATKEELERFILSRARLWDEWRAATLITLRSRLQHCGATLQ